MKDSHCRFENSAPILRVEDVPRSVDFYVNVLGFENADWGDDQFTCVSRDGAAIYLCARDQGQPGTWVWIGVEAVRPLFELYLARGAKIEMPPTNFPWALEMRITDPDGHVLRFGSEPEQRADHTR